MTPEETLFSGYEPAPAEPMSADRARTARQHAQVAAGIHPLTRGPLHPDAPRDTNSTDRARPTTCGTCAHRSTAGRYPKCTLLVFGKPIYVTNGPATDVRAWWPGCPDHEPKADA